MPETQRARLLEAMVRAIAAKGDAPVAVADVTERAGVIEIDTTTACGPRAPMS